MQLLCRPIRARSQIPDIKNLSLSRRCPSCCLSKRSKRQGKRRDGYSQFKGYTCVTIVKYGLSKLLMFYNDWCMYELFVNRPLALRDRSLFITWGGGGRRIWGRDHLIFRRTEGGISRNWEPKRGGSLKILEGFRGGTTQICLNNASLKAYNINVPILLGDDSICNLNLF